MRTYELKKQPGLPLYESLYRCIRRDILDGTLAAGERLPSKRALAKNLEVGKTTVEAAYGQLLDEGYITAREKVGFFVAQIAGSAPASVPISEPAAPAQPGLDITANGIGHFPFTVWNKLQREVVLDYDKELLSPMPKFGCPELRQAIARHLADFRGMQVNPDNVLVGAGTDYLYNILVQLLGRNRGYAVEEPGYAKIRSVYTACGARCSSVEVDSQGAVAEIPGEASVLHISPSHHFPTGVIMSMARRQALLSWVAAGDRYIIEDDFDSEFRFSGHPKPALQSMDSRRVVYMNTFSKSLAPSIRIGYLVLPEGLKQKFIRQLGFYGCTVPSLEQYTLARFLSRGYFEKHINRMRRFYDLRRRELIGALAPFGDLMQVEEQAAGLHFLLHVKTQLPDSQLVAKLADAGIRALTLSDYYFRPEQAPAHRLVVNYSGLEVRDFSRLPEALQRIL